MRTFIDTNVIVYANDDAEPEKQAKALDLVCGLLESGEGVISTQVLSEYAAVALAKLGQAEAVVIHQLHYLESMAVTLVQGDIVRRAVEISRLYGTSFWDSQIIAAAEASGCQTLLSEDLNPGQHYAQVICRNPFV
jgi:predicted nucleic acid-binding protein